MGGPRERFPASLGIFVFHDLPPPPAANLLSFSPKIPTHHSYGRKLVPNSSNPCATKPTRGMMDCKRALTEANGDLEKAETILRKKGILKAEGKGSRAAKEGVVASYIHLQGKVGVLVEVNCETDFVARNEAFREFVKDITLHIAASSPSVVNREEVPAEKIEKERDIARSQVTGKPTNVIEKIVEGQDRQILQHGLPDGSGVHQEHRQPDDQGLRQNQDRAAWREHRHPSFQPATWWARNSARTRRLPSPEETPAKEDVKVS